MLKKVLKQYLTVSLVLFFGVILWSIPLVKSGWKYNYGLGFWGANGHDGVWHIALSNKISNFNFDNPVFSNYTVKNYHLGFDVFLSFIHRITGIYTSNLYFQILPPIFALLIGFLTYVFVVDWTGSKKAGIMSVIFTYIGGSAAWIVGKGESAFWSQQAISTLINPPFALSLIFILLGLISINRNKMFLSVLSFGFLIQIKAYSAILILFGLFILSVYSYFYKKSTFEFYIFLLSLSLNTILFLIVPNDGLSTFSWQPFWFLETMMSYSDRVGWQRFYSAMTTYKMGNFILKEFLFYSIALVIFLIGNFWTRALFILDIFKKNDAYKIALISMLGLGIMIPLFFVQNGTPWNSIQFMYYSLFFSGILAGVSISNYNIQNIILVMLLTVPTTLITLKDIYLPTRPPAKISISELEALNFLKGEPDGIILTFPYDSDKAKEAINNPPRPLYLYESTAYVSAYSGKSTYLEDEVNLNIMGYKWKERRDSVLEWIKEKDQDAANNFLKNNNIKYVYWVKPQRALLGESQLGLVKIFENNDCIIYRYGQDISGN